MEQRRPVGFSRGIHQRAVVRPVRRSALTPSVPPVVKANPPVTLQASKPKVARTHKPSHVTAQQQVSKTPVAVIRVKPRFKKKLRLVQPKQINDVVKPVHKITQSKKTLQPLRPAQPLFQNSNIIKVQKPLEVVPAQQTVVDTPQLSHKPEPVVVKPTRKQKVNKMQLAFMGAGIFIFIAGSIVTVMGVRTNHEVAAQTQQTAQTQQQATAADDAHPDESDPDPKAISNYTVAPDLPKTLSIPKLKVSSRILSMGVKADSQLMAPAGIYDAGWYNASAKPGQQGAMLLDGHVSGPTKPGVFKNIKNLVTGDQIKVERGDGTVVTYKVVSSKSYSAENTDMAAALTPIEPGKPGLNLITCSGPFDKKTQLYTERLIVFATLVE